MAKGSRNSDAGSAEKTARCSSALTNRNKLDYLIEQYKYENQQCSNKISALRERLENQWQHMSKERTPKTTANERPRTSSALGSYTNGSLTAKGAPKSSLRVSYKY